MKILLAYKCHDLGRMEFYSRFTPLGLGTIAAHLRREGFDATLVNLSSWSWPKVARYLAAERADLVGISAFTFNRHEAMRVAALARAARSDALVVAGGPHATHLPEALLAAYPAVDLIVRGEGEETLLDLAQRVAAGEPARGPGAAATLATIPGITWRDGATLRVNPDRPVITELDRLPHPAADPAIVGIEADSQFEFIITSRGCPAACTFCSSPEFWGRGLRFRSAAHMIDEVRLLRERHGVVYVSVRDDTFTVNKKRVIDFCRGLIDAKIDLLWDCQSRVNIVDEERLVWMRRAGCTHIQYGVESGSPRMLERLNKGIRLEEIRTAAALTRKVGLGLSIYLITGIDSETDDDLASTLRLIEEIRPHDGLVSPLTVYPGTGLYEQAKRKFGLTDAYWVEDRREAYYVREDPWTRRAVRTLGAALKRVGRAAAYGPDDFARQRALVGDCYALRLAVGEYAARRGRLKAAAAEYERLLAESPGSLWARMRLGDIAMRRRRPGEAVQHYRAATGIVPAFAHARRMLRESQALAAAAATIATRRKPAATRPLSARRPTARASAVHGTA